MGKNVCFYIFRPSPIVVERDNVENGIMVKAQFSNQSNQSSEGRARAIRQAKHSAGQMDSRIIAGLLGNVAAAGEREGGGESTPRDHVSSCNSLFGRAFPL